MKAPQEALLAYVATLIAIVLLVVAGVLVAVLTPVQDETDFARLLGALGFISAGVAGLTGVIGTFRPKGRDEPPQNEEPMP